MTFKSKETEAKIQQLDELSEIMERYNLHGIKPTHSSRKITESCFLDISASEIPNYKLSGSVYKGTYNAQNSYKPPLWVQEILDK